MSSRSDDAAGRPLSKQPCGTFVVTSQATSLVGEGVSRLLLAPCLRRHHKRLFLTVSRFMPSSSWKVPRMLYNSWNIPADVIQ